MKKSIIVIISFIFLTSSCVVSKKEVGKFDSKNCKNIETVKDKDFYIFWNQVKINEIETKIPYKNYEIVKKRNVFDGIVFYGTLGTLSFYTVNIKVCKDK